MAPVACFIETSIKTGSTLMNMRMAVDMSYINIVGQSRREIQKIKNIVLRYSLSHHERNERKTILGIFDLKEMR
jgi:cytochrome c oxidase assembly protein Cox11